MNYGLYEKQNRYALHGIFSSRERAENHLKNVIPEYVRKGYFTDKKLTANSFVVRRYKAGK